MENEEVVVPETDETEVGEEVVAEVSDDPWGDAEAAFKEGSEEVVEVPEAQEAKVEKEETGDVKPEKTGEVGIEALAIPHKYKPAVQKWVDSKVASVSEEAKSFKANSAELAKAFIEICKSEDPLKALKGYAEQAVQGGLPEDLLKNFGAKEEAKEAPEQTVDWSGIKERTRNALVEIENKYWPLLEAEQDPKRAREFFSKMEMEKTDLMEAVSDAKQKLMFAAFYNKLVKPKFGEYESLKEEAQKEKVDSEISRKKGIWNTADSEIAKVHKDWPKYRAKVKDLIKSRYKGVLNEINTTGKGHLELMKDVYLIVSREDHFKDAKRPVRGSPGLKPGGRHIETQKAGGSGWDDIKQNLWSDVIPAD